VKLSAPEVIPMEPPEITSQPMSQIEIINREILIFNPNPEAIARYHVNRFIISSGEMAASESLLAPVHPIEGIQAIGHMILKREWEFARKMEKRKTSFKPSQHIEKSIQLLMKEFNDHQVELGKLLYVALARTEENYVVNVYDCSFMDYCKIVEDIPLDPDELPTLMANLQQESGILVDMRT